ncbi:MAG TPA: TonB family protein [Rhizomicrobium sp.]
MLLQKNEMTGIGATGMTPRRALTIAGVGLLHVAAIYALINGMATTALIQIEHIIQVPIIETAAPPKQVLVPPPPTLVKPTEVIPQVVVVPPVIDIARTDPPPIATIVAPPNTPPPVDSGASGLAGTHSTPPYPVEARAQSHQGTVLLQLAISAQGDVMSANVVQSSGFPELDSAAVTWVVAHWKYKPALQGGVPMPSQTQAAVKFDLKLARR